MTYTPQKGRGPFWTYPVDSAPFTETNVESHSFGVPKRPRRRLQTIKSVDVWPKEILTAGNIFRTIANYEEVRKSIAIAPGVCLETSTSDRRPALEGLD